MTGFDVEGTGESVYPVSPQMMRDSNERFGLRHAVIVPVHSFDRKLEGGMKLGISETLDTFARRLDAKAHLLHSAALSAHARLQQLIRLDVAQSILLASREREVLLWLARGLRTAEIAHRLNLKEVTINLHVVKARRKPEAASREQAVAGAIIVGAITP